MEAVLRGHTGCVNRLAWNEAGTLLASASDDRQVRWLEFCWRAFILDTIIPRRGLQILLWHYPDTQRDPLRVETQHKGNLFGVAFLNASQLVSGSMDCSVQLHSLEANPLHHAPSFKTVRRQPAGMVRQVDIGEGGLPTARAHTTVFKCHEGRVKAIRVEVGLFICLILLAMGVARLQAVETEPQNPHNFWSASEDGTVRQFDTRR